MVNYKLFPNKVYLDFLEIREVDYNVEKQLVFRELNKNLLYIKK